MKKLFLLFTLLISLTALANGDIDIRHIGWYYGQTITGVQPLADGESYARIEGSAIVRYSFSTGEQLGVIFDANNARDYQLDDIDDYIMSPDERRILIQTNTNPIYRHSFTAEYYIYDVASRHLTPLSTAGPQQVPVWSHDGNSIAFVRDNNIFLCKLLYGNAEIQVTQDGKFNEVLNGIPDWVNEEEFAVDRHLVFTADDEMLVWVRADESQVPMFSFPMYRGMYPSLLQNATYPGAYSYKYPVAGERNSTVSVMSYDIKARVTRTLRVPLPDEGYIPRIYATNLPNKVAVFTLNRHQDQLDVYLADARSTESQLIVRDNVNQYISEDAYSQIIFVDGGLYMCSERDGYNRIYEYSLTGQLRRTIGTDNMVVTNLYGVDNNGNVYFAARNGDPTRKYIYTADRRSRTTCLTPTDGTHDATFSTSMRYFLHTYSNINTPFVVTLCDNRGRTLRTLEDNTNLNSTLSKLNLGTRELFTFTTSEGVLLYGYMVKPHDFDPSRQYPVMMFQYSGPGSQQVLDKWSCGSMGAGTMFEHYMCQQGFICVTVDGRGTGGRGAEFEHTTYLNLGQLESRDQVETALYLGTLPYIDAQHIGIWGWSFGGFNTLMSMSEGRPVFCCGVAVAPPTDWHFYDTIYTERFMRTPRENPTGYARNPISQAQQLHGSLLICHGLADDNVHFRNVAEYTEALVQADKDFRQLTYTNRNHSIYDNIGQTRRHLVRQIANHFITNCRP